MKHYIIDGNNLIGKIPQLMSLQRQDNYSSRFKLSSLVENYFRQKNALVTLHFDGFETNYIGNAKARIVYSGKKTADDKIRNEIDYSKNPKNIIVVTSDTAVADYSRKCACQVIKSEDFGKELTSHREPAGEDEESIINKLRNDADEFKKLFGG